LNSLVPFILSAEKNIPVLDIDFMGRAYPYITYLTSVMYGEKIFPISFSNDRGDTRLFQEEEVLTEKSLESKKANPEQFDYEVDWLKAGKMIGELAESWSNVAGIGFAPLNKAQIGRVGVKYSLSRARNLGEAMCRMRVSKSGSLKSVIEELENARFIFEGKVIVVDKSFKEKSEGHLTVEGFGEYRGREMDVYFKNETIIARQRKTGEDTAEVVATTPDLIALLDIESLDGVLVENFNYGQKVYVISIPANDLLTGKLELTGPKSFGEYFKDIPYKPFGTEKKTKSVLS